MNKLIEKPHLIFLLSIPILMTIGFISKGATLDINGDAVLNFNVHDTYFVITYIHLITLISILFGIIGLGYWIMQKANRKLSKWLNLIHIVLTFGGILFVLILAQLYREKVMGNDFNNNLTLIITLISLIIILGQIIFPINIIYGLIKKNSKTGG